MSDIATIICLLSIEYPPYKETPNLANFYISSTSDLRLTGCISAWSTASTLGSISFWSSSHSLNRSKLSWSCGCAGSSRHARFILCSISSGFSETQIQHLVRPPFIDAPICEISRCRQISQWMSRLTVRPTKILCEIIFHWKHAASERNSYIFFITRSISNYLYNVAYSAVH